MRRRTLRTEFLLPLWLVRLVIMFVLTVIYVIALSILSTTYDSIIEQVLPAEGFRGGNSLDAEVTAFYFIKAFLWTIGVCEIVDVISIIFHFSHILTPQTFLCLILLEVTSITATLVLTIIAWAQWGFAPIYVFTFIVALLFYGHLIYAVWGFRRDRQMCRRDLQDKNKVVALYSGGPSMNSSKVPMTYYAAGAQPAEPLPIPAPPRRPDRPEALAPVRIPQTPQAREFRSDAAHYEERQPLRNDII